MADAAAARREARRRRILENSQNRLQQISGKCVDTIREAPSRSSILEDSLEDLPSSSRDDFTLPAINISNGALFSELEASGLLPTSDNLTAAGDGEATNEFLPPTTAATEVVRTKSLFEKLTENKYDVVLLSFIIQLLYSCSLFSLKETYFFLPLVMYDVTKLIWFPPQSQSQLANVFLMMQGVSRPRAQSLLKLWHCVQEVLLDGCVYLFTVICIQSLLIGMSLGT